MGWKAFYQNGTVEAEGDTKTLPDGTIEGVGRPVQAGENGELICIAQEDFGHKVAVDLVNGIVCLEYDDIQMQNGSLELQGPKVLFNICEETNIIGDFKHRLESDVDEKGNYTIDYLPLVWRPIWFTRNTNGIPTKVIGAQTTTPDEMGGRNIKKLISIFVDGRLGVD